MQYQMDTAGNIVMSRNPTMPSIIKFGSQNNTGRGYAWSWFGVMGIVHHSHGISELGLKFLSVNIGGRKIEKELEKKSVQNVYGYLDWS